MKRSDTLAVVAVLALLALSAWLPVAAQTIPDRMGVCEAYKAQVANNPPPNESETRECMADPHADHVGEVCLVRRFTAGGQMYFMNCWGYDQQQACGVGQSKDPATNLCKCDNGYAFDPYHPAECLNSNKCLARNASLSPEPRVGSSSSVCTGGCEYKIVESCGTVTVGGTQTTCGVWEYSGNACGSLPPPGPGEGPGDPPKPQQCTPAGDGQTFCLKPDGNHCASASTGREICWRPGETGEKDDGPIKQKRDAGHDPIPPNLQLPSGDNLTPVGQPIRAVTNINNQTINTVTQNYQTAHGTNAGSTNKGESASGDGSGKEVKGDGSASGGGDCKTPPITSGDPVLGMVATQAWHTRCAVEAGNAAKVSGDIGDCKQAFTVEGTNANAIKLRAMRAQICGGDKNGNGRPDWTETNGTETPEPGQGEDKPSVFAKLINTDALDGGGFLGGASCPQMGVVDLHFTTVDLSNASWWCPFVAMCRAILLLMGAYISIRLMME